jgi:hypothetical protein
MVVLCLCQMRATCPQVYSGGLDNAVSVWELQKGTVGLKLSGHSNTTL